MTFWRRASAVLCASVTLLTGALVSNRSDTTDAADAFFPVAVWYGGGKARAPMQERLDATSAERWGKDLDAIKAAGFNTVKTWVDWATAGPREGEFSFANLDLLLRLARGRGLKVETAERRTRLALGFAPRIFGTADSRGLRAPGRT